MPTRDPTRPPPSLQKQFLRACRAAGKRLKVADSLGTRLTGHELLVRVLAVRALLERTLAPDERMVGVMLPPTAGAAVVIMKTFLSIAAALALTAASFRGAEAAEESPATQLFARYCVSCHGPAKQEAKVRLDLSPADLAANHKLLEKVALVLEDG
ncbi:MAG: hypothetical protein ACKO35_09430, partial [Planctomycetaceae bacterium]